MKKEVQCKNGKIEYDLKISNRAKRLRLAIFCDGRCEVTAPLLTPPFLINEFIQEKSQWILNKIEGFKNSGVVLWPKHTEAEQKQFRALALTLAENRISHFNKFYNFDINRICIKDQKTRWGSCSKKKNLNFSYKIALLPERLADYIIVHELCHLGELNHSNNFWSLVSQTMPAYKQLRKEINKYRIA